MSECQRLDCTAPGTYVPILEWKPINSPDYVGPAIVNTLPIKVCSVHAKDRAANDALRMDMLIKIADWCRENQKIPPDPDTAVFRWEALQ